MHPTKHAIKYAALPLGALLAAGVQAQTAETASAAAPAAEDEVIVLSPFEVTASESTGYVATTTLAGSRINTQLKDVGSAISVVTSEFLKDTGATDSKSLLLYTVSTEVASIQGNFTQARSGNQDEGGTFTTPNTNTRVRGLTSADNTRGFFMTNIPWDAYNVDRVDMQRGPNAILFGMGSPAGIINTTTKTAQFRNFGEVEFRYGSYGANRVSLDYNHVLLEDELALRVNLVRNDEQYKQQPAYSLDRRIFVTGRYEPKFLNKGDHKTSIKVNYESGSVRSNNPRVITPVDFVSSWFTDLNQATYNPWIANDLDPRYTYDSTDAVTGATYPQNAGQQIGNYPNRIANGGAWNAGADQAGPGANPAYVNRLTGVASSYSSSALTFFKAGETSPYLMNHNGFSNTLHGRNSAGGTDGTIQGFPNWNRVGLVSQSTYAARVGLPFSNAGLWNDQTLTDPSIFDFYNNLLDGENKDEWQNFHNFSTSLSQTFFKQKLGFEIAYDQSVYRRGQYSLMTDWRAGLMIDVNSYNIDGSPNTNVGKPFIADAGIYGNNDTQTNREASRASVYYDHNFNEDGKGRWFMKLLGRHTISGLYSQDMFREDRRTFMRWGTGLDMAGLMTNNPLTQSIKDNTRVVHPVVYLSDESLIGAPSLSGIKIPRAGGAIQMPSNSTYTYFDSTWTATGVNPGDRWISTRTQNVSTQSENPENYAGWRTTNLAILDSKNPEQREALTFEAALAKKKSDSRVAVWQAYFWDGAIVGMYGIRRDSVKSWSRSGHPATMTASADPALSYAADPIGDQHIVFDKVVTENGTTGVQYSTAPWPYSVTTANTPSWSVVAHLSKLLGRWGDKLPVDVSYFYNSSSNFEISGTRSTIYGSPIAPSSGKTLDRGVLIATKDGRFSLRINKYESSIKDASSSAGLNTWLIGNNGDTLFTRGETYADRYEYNLGTAGDMSTANNGQTWNYDFQTRAGQTVASAAAQEAAAVAGWRTLTARPEIQRFLKAFGYSDFNVTQLPSLTQLPSFRLTEDQVSRGWEFELTANPTKNWRLSFNASKTEAMRTNLGGSDFTEFVRIVNEAMVGPAGDIRLYWGGSPAENELRYDWNQVLYSKYVQMRLQEGTYSSELRKWRFNLVTNYDFTEGRLKGVNVGVGYRWQDKVAIGYPVSLDADGALTYDIKNPYMGPREDAVDFWIGYGKKLTERINWRIQLNVRNAFDGNKLIPLTVQPDGKGTPAAWRIAPAQTWQITNTFSF